MLLKGLFIRDLSRFFMNTPCVGFLKEITIWFMKKNIRMSLLFLCSLRRAGTGTGSRSSFLPTLMLSTLGLNRKEIFS